MPSPSSYVEPSVMSFPPSAGVYVGDHLGVHHEAPGGDHGRSCPDNPGVTERTPGQPYDGAGLVGHQAGRAGLVPHLDAGLLNPVPQQVHHQLRSPGVPRHRDLVPARRRRRLIPERPHLLVAGEHQPFGTRLDHGLAGEEGALELEAQRLQPAEVLDRPLAVGADLVVLGLLRRRDQVLVHLFRRSPRDRSPAAPPCPRRGRNARRPCRWSPRARRPARAAAPGRQPGPPPGPRFRRRCRSR